MIRRGTIAGVVLAVVINAGLIQAKSSPDNGHKSVAEQIRHEIAVLPYNGIYDWVEAELLTDGTVVLRGNVTRPSTKTDAEFRIRGIETVSKVVNEIKVLPLSQYDNDIRISVYRSLFNGNSPLLGYALGANPSIHIIVENGRVTLKGVVASAMDKQLAALAAKGVFGVLSVENQLRLESEL
jgi:hyperosmotically inducible protein